MRCFLGGCAVPGPWAREPGKTPFVVGLGALPLRTVTVGPIRYGTCTGHWGGVASHAAQYSRWNIYIYIYIYIYTYIHPIFDGINMLIISYCKIWSWILGFILELRKPTRWLQKLSAMYRSWLENATTVAPLIPRDSDTPVSRHCRACSHTPIDRRLRQSVHSGLVILVYIYIYIYLHIHPIFDPINMLIISYQNIWSWIPGFILRVRSPPGGSGGPRWPHFGAPMAHF